MDVSTGVSAKIKTVEKLLARVSACPKCEVDVGTWKPSYPLHARHAACHATGHGAGHGSSTVIAGGLHWMLECILQFLERFRVPLPRCPAITAGSLYRYHCQAWKVPMIVRHAPHNKRVTAMSVYSNRAAHRLPLLRVGTVSSVYV
jgi:hypothetical protein